MDKLFNWLYNLNNPKVAPDSEPKEQETIPVEETTLPHQVECIELLSSDDDEKAQPTRTQNMNNIIDLTMEDDDSGPSRRTGGGGRIRNPLLSHRRSKAAARRLAASGGYAYSNALNPLSPSRVKKAIRRADKMSLRKSRRTAKRQWEIEMTAKTILGRCSDCLYRYTFNDPVLSQYHSYGLCRGCFLLHQSALLEGDNMNDVFHWLKTGELSVDVWNNEVDNAKEERLVKRRAGDMRSRMTKHTNKCQQVATQDDLYDLYLDSECKCAITGWTCHFSRNNEQKFWVVTFDHIVPVSKAKQGVNPWVISNIQVMCHLLNQIKGNYPDEELRRWFQLWKQAQL